MSSYEDYTRKSGNYDKTREPVGTEILVGCFAHAPVSLDRTVVLDAGCGTGSYSDALLHYVGRIEAVDMNAAMLEVAARKLAWAGDRISFHSSRIEELPFEDANLDGVMINQVLHHLPDDASEGFPAHRLAFQEFARVLKPGGSSRSAPARKSNCATATGITTLFRRPPMLSETATYPSTSCSKSSTIAVSHRGASRPPTPRSRASLTLILAVP